MNSRPIRVALLAALAAGPMYGAAAPQEPAHKMPTLLVDTSPVGEAGRTAVVMSYADALEPVQLSVVTVDSKKTVPLPPQLRRMIPRNQQQDPTEMGVGSGVIVSADGYIVTNNHVVEGADKNGISVKFSDGREFEAVLIGADPQTDIAVIKIEAEGLKPITFADSDKLRVGDVVFAVGNPLAIGQTITMGIVSAKGRSIGILDNVKGYEDFIQTDAAINMGNSGGALVDARGRLVGISSAMVAPSQTGDIAGSIGLGFAVPVNIATMVMKGLVERGTVSRGYLGLDVEPITPDLAASLELKNDVRGVVVNRVIPDTPAEKMGMKLYDVILSLDGRSVTSRDELKVLVAQKSPGSITSLRYLRAGKEESIDITLVAMNPLGPTELFKGIAVATLNDDLRRQHRISNNIAGGLVVTGIEPTSPFAGKFEVGSVILMINRTEVTELDAARKALLTSAPAPRGAGTIANLLVAPARGQPQILTIPLEDNR